MTTETLHIGAEPIGADLRAERERRELSLAAIAEELHVRPSYLAAIERGERPNTPDVLPGVGYVLGYVRAYADFVGLDGDKAVDRYKADMAIPENLRLRDAPHIVPKRRRRKLPRGLVPAVAVIAGAIGFAAYYAIQPGAEADTPDQAPVVASGEAEIGPDSWVLRASTASWVRVVGADGTEMFNAIMVPGQVLALPEGSGPIVDARDAGAVSVRLGARDFGPLGPRGRSVEAVRLDERLAPESVGGEG